AETQNLPPREAAAEIAAPSDKPIRALPEIGLNDALFEPANPAPPPEALEAASAAAAPGLAEKCNAGEDDLSNFLFEPVTPATLELARAAPTIAEMTIVPEPPPAAPAIEPVAEPVIDIAPLTVTPAPKSRTLPPRPSPRSHPADPLAPLWALSEEERIALFS